jgi:hypothetical protein
MRATAYAAKLFASLPPPASTKGSRRSSTRIICTADHWPSPRAALAAAARVHDRQVSLTSASGCATMVANMIPLMMTDQAVSQ